jgi:hypothetical protein
VRRRFRSRHPRSGNHRRQCPRSSDCVHRPAPTTSESEDPGPEAAALMTRLDRPQSALTRSSPHASTRATTPLTPMSRSHTGSRATGASHWSQTRPALLRRAATTHHCNPCGCPILGPHGRRAAPILSPTRHGDLSAANAHAQTPSQTKPSLSRSRASTADLLQESSGTLFW